MCALEEGDTFGDSDDDDKVMENTQLSNDNSSSDDDLDIQESSPLNIPTATSTDKSKSGLKVRHLIEKCESFQSWCHEVQKC